MPFVKKSFWIEEPIKAFVFIIRQFKYTQGESQRLISKGRLLIKGESFYDKAGMIEGKVEVVFFEPHSRGIAPILTTPDFILFDKPSGIMVHPNTMATEYSMLDEIRHHSGDRANATHRIDMETSGLLLASRHKKAEQYLKSSFEKKWIQKEYLAWVTGQLETPFCVNEPIRVRDNYDTLKHKVSIDQEGKASKTVFTPLFYDKGLDATLVQCKPLTGRTHQIRLHLFHVKHPILGDPLYGTDFETSTLYLEGRLSKEKRFVKTGATRLLLHAHRLQFPYGCQYDLSSHIDFVNMKREICRKETRQFNR
ncbi:MAG TPA: RNA pseudouridine synthase [Campylobacterales bacterium]|nr:RNA pseudouridine synthase [Campylobacterales bacterium]